MQSVKPMILCFYKYLDFEPGILVSLYCLLHLLVIGEGLQLFLFQVLGSARDKNTKQKQSARVGTGLIQRE